MPPWAGIRHREALQASNGRRVVSVAREPRIAPGAAGSVHSHTRAQRSQHIAGTRHSTGQHTALTRRVFVRLVVSVGCAQHARAIKRPDAARSRTTLACPRPDASTTPRTGSSAPVTARFHVDPARGRVHGHSIGRPCEAAQQRTLRRGGHTRRPSASPRPGASPCRPPGPLTHCTPGGTRIIVREGAGCT